MKNTVETLSKSEILAGIESTIKRKAGTEKNAMGVNETFYNSYYHHRYVLHEWQKYSIQRMCTCRYDRKRTKKHCQVSRLCS